MRIFAFVSALLISIVLSSPALGANKKGGMEEPDTIPLFRGVAVSADLVGPLMLLVSDYGQYEGAVRVNLKDRYFPVLEFGYGMGKHPEDAVTGIASEAKAPYGRVGLDLNVLKNKHDLYRLYAGARYAFTSFKHSVSNTSISDPVWGGNVNFSVLDERSYYHWLEGIFGVDVCMTGPFRIGWSVRYKLRLANSDSQTGAFWYVPGYGKHDSSLWSGTFNLTIEL